MQPRLLRQRVRLILRRVLPSPLLHLRRQLQLLRGAVHSKSLVWRQQMFSGIA